MLPVFVHHSLFLQLSHFGGGDPTPRHFSSQHCLDVHWLFTCGSFDTIFVKIELSIMMLDGLLYMPVGPKKWLKTWFCVQIKCKWSFLTFLIIKFWLLSILFAEFVKRSARFDGKIVRLDSKSGNINITAKNVEAGGFIHPPPWPLRVTKVVCTCACSCNITLNL